MPSVRVKVSKFGKFSHLKERATMLTKPWFYAILLFVATRTASVKSLPKPSLPVPDYTAPAFSCFLKQVNVSPTDAPIIIYFCVCVVKI